MFKIKLVKLHQEHVRMELDSHTDTCCVGAGIKILNKGHRIVKVTSLLEKLGAVSNVPIVTATVAYDNPRDGQIHILIIHQALYFKSMDHCLRLRLKLNLNFLHC